MIELLLKAKGSYAMIWIETEKISMKIEQFWHASPWANLRDKSEKSSRFLRKPSAVSQDVYPTDLLDGVTCNHTTKRIICFESK